MRNKSNMFGHKNVRCSIILKIKMFTKHYTISECCWLQGYNCHPSISLIRITYLGSCLCIACVCPTTLVHTVLTCYIRDPPPFWMGGQWWGVVQQQPRCPCTSSVVYRCYNFLRNLDKSKINIIWLNIHMECSHVLSVQYGPMSSQHVAPVHMKYNPRPCLDCPLTMPLSMATIF